MTTTGQLNFLGIYKKYNSNGSLFIYYVGDVVEFEGKRYAATRTITGVTPFALNSGWVELSGQSGFFIQEVTPINSTIGDRWLNPITGVLYTKIKDDQNNNHWVEI